MLMACLRMCEPSRGGMGMRLNTKRTQFNMTIVLYKLSTLGEIGRPAATQMVKNKVASKAMSKFDKGPAMVIKMSSLLRVFGLGSEILTGFPQPNIAKIWAPKIIIKGSRIVPMGSMWARGSRVTRPSARGSGSPSLSAVIAWAHSCTLKLPNSTTNKMIFSSILGPDAEERNISSVINRTG